MRILHFLEGLKVYLSQRVMKLASSVDVKQPRVVSTRRRGTIGAGRHSLARSAYVVAEVTFTAAARIPLRDAADINPKAIGYAS